MMAWLNRVFVNNGSAGLYIAWNLSCKTVHADTASAAAETIKYEGCCTDCRVWTASVTCDILEQKEGRVALKKRLHQVNKIKTKITILDVEREDRFGPLFLHDFFISLS